ncbi:hypothetical protein GCM10010317_077130 [Streptomyces mirabilis]|uniref:hypothetical protein n=1 Tax=Streptomyces mirabilis TaxID=68239 RepID=UPI00167EDBBE|nr:hypothetical protein [Streptomyces mirabilis]GHD70240.1 hypothetical protein GCM10010317_077130 [Streptomyces mirabilis]
MRAGPGTKAADHLIGAPAHTGRLFAARDIVRAAIAHAGTRADNATVLVADLQPAAYA